MGTFFLNIDASSIYSVDAPVLEILVDGVVVGSLSIDSGFTNSTLGFSFSGTYPSSLSFRFNDGSGESGRSITINSVSINGQNVNSHVSQTVLNQNDNATVNTVATKNLFGEEDLTLADLDPVTITGTAGLDSLKGTSGNDVIDGQDSNDNIKGFDGDDQISAGDGNDIVRGGNGNDIALGDGGNDNMRGEAGNDSLYGGAGMDYLDGGAGDDFLSGGADNDTLRGGDGNDTLLGGDGNDVLKGEAGNDTIVGGAGLDLLEGSVGEDNLSGGDDNDTLRGGDDNDILNGDNGNDRLFGDDGDDTLNGGNGNDRLEGGVGNDTLNGGAGLDLIRGGAGEDIIDGGDDNDQVYGGDGNDTITGGDGWDRVEGEAGNDTLNGGLGSDTVLGGSGIDYVYGDDGNDRVRGGEDDDFVYGGDGNDQVFGDEGDDEVYGGAGNDLVNGNDGDDILYGEAGLDKIYGHEGNDTIYGGDDNDRIFGNQGDDIINGDDGNDTLYASSVHEIVNETTTISSSIFNEDFSGGANGFTYSDGGFGGSDPGGFNYALGNHYTGMGTGGSVYVYTTSNNSTVNNVSGNWSNTFTITEAATNVQLTLDYKLYHANNEAGEDAQVYVEINGVQYGLNGNNYFAEALGGSGTINTPFTTVTLDIADLGVGTHTISFGMLKTSTNASGEISYTIFDNIDISADKEIVYNGLKIMDEGATNEVNGGAGADKIYGSSGNDTLNGGTGNDAIHSGTTQTVDDAIADILANNAGVTYDATTNSFYQYVSGSFTWAQADAAAQAATLVGLDGATGYLTTITSAAETNVVMGLTGTSFAWINGSDAGVEGEWIYTSGPETGTQFWQGNQSGSAVGGAYTNWYSGGAPLDSNGDYDYNIFLGSNYSGQQYAYLGSYQTGYVVEWDGNALFDVIGTNILNGGDGADDLYGSAGTDIFLFDNTNDVDDIFDFDTSTGDQLDLSDILSFNPGTDDINDFVQLSEAGGNTTISVDVDGTANGVNFVDIALIDNVTGLNVATMLADGTLIAS